MAVLIAPMAEWKPFTGKTPKHLTTPDIICAHTMVGKLIGSWDWANQPGNSYWHYGLGADGRLLQCVDLNLRSAANLDGNDRVIPIETEDGYPDGRTSDTGQVWAPWTGSDVPAWTDAQIDRLVELCVWLCLKFNIPPVMIPDTKQGRRGLAYHRQGINPWRVDGGEKWSNSDGKVCPGDRRVNQWVNVVVPRIAMGVNPIPTPTPQPEDDDMKDFIISAPSRPISLMRGDKLIKFGDMDTVKSFQAAGVETVKPTTRDFDKIEQVLAAAELVDDVSVPNPD